MEFNKALEKCMYICSQREYCSFDIEEKLSSWEVDLNKHHEIIKTLIAEKFIDNNRFVSAFVKDKFTFNHWGKIKIRYHLKQKRIDDPTIKKFLDEIDISAYDGAIIEEIEKKRHSVKGATEFEKKQKIARYVISKGFEPNKVFDMLKLD